jgi:hypothetical protein
VPAVTASNTIRWPLSGPATGGLAVLLLVLMGATGALIRWHPRPRTIPVIQVRLTTQPGYFPQLAGDRNSRIHAIHWQLRTEGPTMDGPRP